MQQLTVARNTLAALAGILSLLASTYPAGAETTGSVWDGVYTDDQAARGGLQACAILTG